jgi:hypothetical protein
MTALNRSSECRQFFEEDQLLRSSITRYCETWEAVAQRNQEAAAPSTATEAGD